MTHETIARIQQLLANKEGIVVGTDSKNSILVAADFDIGNVRGDTEALSKITFLLTNLLKAMGLDEDQAISVIKVGYNNTQDVYVRPELQEEQ